MSRTDEQSQGSGTQDVADQQSGTDQRQAFRVAADRPRPYSYEDLCRRLERLPRGHPSSPYNADGSRKPPPPRLRDLELPLPGEDPGDPDASDEGESAPARLDAHADAEDGELGELRWLRPVPEPDGGADRARHATPDQDGSAPPRLEPRTDAEHAEHVQYVAERLDWARREGLATDRQFMDERTGVWAKDRRDMHDAIVEEIYARAADVPNDRRAVMAGGLAGAGKPTVLEHCAGMDRTSYLTIIPDDIKEELAKQDFVPDVAGLSPMEASDLVHEESSHVAKLLTGRAVADGKNIVWDITMAGRPSVDDRLEDLKSAGYQIKGIFVDIPIEESVRRSDERYRRGRKRYCEGVGEGGRYVPPEVIRSRADPEWGSQNRRTFESVRHRFADWMVYDNSVPGRAPLIITSSETGGSSEPRSDR